MSLGIRTEAAIVNEKNLDAGLAIDALYYGIELFKQIANGKVVSEIIDIYENKAYKIAANKGSSWKIVGNF